MVSVDKEPLHIYDVIIVGAGISGCGAAWYLKKHGRTALILEATDRIGGKTYTVPDGCTRSGHIDLGASWVNDTSQSYINVLIEELGLERLIQSTEGLYIGQTQDGDFYTHDVHDHSMKRGDNLFDFLTKLQEVCEIVNKADVVSTPGAAELDVTIAEWVAKTFPGRPNMADRVDMFVRTVCGADINEASFLYIAHYFACGEGVKSMCGEEKDDAQYQRLMDGTQSIPNAVVVRLPKESVLVNHAVRSISQTDDIVIVTTKNGQSLQAKDIIITVPPPLWNFIEWSPPLPERKRAISDSLILPTYSKIVFAFENPWWRPKLSGGVVFAKGPLQMIRDTSIPSKDCWTLTCFSTGKNGAIWGGQSREKRRSSAWETLKSAFAEWADNIPEPVAVREMLWERHEYFWGAPSSSWPPGLLSQGYQKDLKAPFGNVHFAGSETSSAWKGFLEGGLRAAERAVEEIVKP